MICSLTNSLPNLVLWSSEDEPYLITLGMERLINGAKEHKAEARVLLKAARARLAQSQKRYPNRRGELESCKTLLSSDTLDPLTFRAREVMKPSKTKAKASSVMRDLMVSWTAAVKSVNDEVGAWDADFVTQLCDGCWKREIQNQ
eukprot:Blabericola_migrator_1__11002@NODE_6386_length_545_cov_8_725941_g4339_i0_p1_GENE_NODE_6386_length_545_cov_8_725941_g4339_i0NODE_6386_length_545_cov_8_725941_g4339_i0_p1_ORF_typecomplete_len145_score23_27_NODE_6386_length_545_cov_8_725941_g4339_i086520